MSAEICCKLGKISFHERINDLSETIEFLVEEYYRHRKKPHRLKVKSLYYAGMPGPEYKAWREKVIERVNYESEISGLPEYYSVMGYSNNRSELFSIVSVHHITSVTKFLKKAIEFLFGDVFGFNLAKFFILDWDVIPKVIFEELNGSNNIFVLNHNEHGEFEGMPITFFEAVRRANAEFDLWDEW